LAKTLFRNRGMIVNRSSERRKNSQGAKGATNHNRKKKQDT